MTTFFIFLAIRLNFSLLSSTKISDNLFHSREFGLWSMPKRNKYKSTTAPKISDDHFFIIPSKISLFHPFSTLTLTKLQQQLHNSPFTTAKIVISYTLN